MPIGPDELVQRHLQGVYNLAFRLTGNAADAWDLAQEALLRAIKALPGFREEASPATWLYRITINLWKNKTQSASSKWWRALLPLERPEDERPREPAGPDPEPSQALEREEEQGAVERALAGLSPEDRAALVLRELDGKSYQEISGILGVPMGTVKSRLFRARAALARELEKRDVP